MIDVLFWEVSAQLQQVLKLLFEKIENCKLLINLIIDRNQGVSKLYSKAN